MPSGDVKPRLSFVQECQVLKGLGLSQSVAAERLHISRRNLILKLKKESLTWTDLIPLTESPPSDPSCEDEVITDHTASLPPQKPRRGGAARSSQPSAIPAHLTNPSKANLLQVAWLSYMHEPTPAWFSTLYKYFEEQQEDDELYQSLANSSVADLTAVINPTERTIEKAPSATSPVNSSASDSSASTNTSIT